MNSRPHLSLATAASRSTLLLSLLLAVMFVRSLVPAGFMPAFSSEGTLGTPVVLCTAQGAIVVSLDADGAPVETHQQLECPFAFALGMAAAPVTIGTMELPAFFAGAIEVTRGAAVVATPPSSFSARGPPSLV